MKNAADVAANWVRGTQNGVQKFVQGVQAVTESPAQAAIRAIPQYVAGTQRAANDGTLQRGLEQVSLPDWKKNTIEKGQARIAPGATAAQGKFQRFMSEFLPHIEAGKRTLHDMPRGDLEANLQRAMTMARHNATFRKS